MGQGVSQSDNEDSAQEDPSESVQKTGLTKEEVEVTGIVEEPTAKDQSKVEQLETMVKNLQNEIRLLKSQIPVIHLISRKIIHHFGDHFELFTDLPAIVSVEENFDKLLIPSDHPSRSLHDSYYVTNTTLLRSYTSAHQNQLLSEGHTRFLVVGDVYRRDEIDKYHYPIFHQMEGVCIVEDGQDPVAELQTVLQRLVAFLFPDCKVEFNADYFPFTDPSFECNVFFNDRWLEILGCGVIADPILKNCGLSGKRGWAFGLGLERLAMILYDIPDIRYFWSNDEKFLSQFDESTVKFIPYSKIDPIIHDLSFWIDEGMHDGKWLLENDFLDLCRNVGGLQLSQVECFDRFTSEKTGRTSHCYHLVYVNLDSDLKDPETFASSIKILHEEIRTMVKTLPVSLR